MSEEILSDVQAALNAGREMAGVQTPGAGGEPFVALPNDFVVESIENLLPAPLRKRGVATLRHEASFCRYVNAHKDADSVVFAELEHHRLTAVLDHHRVGPGGSPRWGEHRAVLQLPMESDWITLKKFNDTRHSQIDFAQLIEDLLPRIAEPDGADLLELAQGLEATNKVVFKSAERLQDGNRRLVYTTETQGKVGNSRIELPDHFVIACPVYWRGDPVKIEAKLRYRIEEGTLKLWYHLHRPEDAEDEAFARICDAVSTETEIEPLLGPGPAASY